MAGGYFNGVTAAANLRHPDRNLHIDGILGFHAPYVDLEAGNYPADVVSEAFSAASQIISQLSERRRYMHFSADLLSRMVSTSSREFFYVDTVGKAASYAINFVGAPTLVFDREGYNVLGLACSNLSMYSYLGLNDGPERYQNLLPAEIRHRASLGWSQDMPRLSGPSPVDIMRVDEIEDLQDVRVSLNYGLLRDSLAVAGEEQSLAFYSAECNLIGIVRNQRIFAVSAWPQTDLNLVYGNDAFPVSQLEGDWWFFPGSLKLSELSELRDLYPGGVQAAQWAPVIFDVYHPECFVSRAGGSFVVQPCVVTRNQARTFDLLEQRSWLSLELPGVSIDRLDFELGSIDDEEVLVVGRGWNYRPRLNDFYTRAGLENPRAELCFTHEEAVVMVCMNGYTFDSVRKETNAPPPFR